MMPVQDEDEKQLESDIEWVRDEDENDILYRIADEDGIQLESDIEWFRRHPTAHRARVVFLMCTKLETDVPADVMELFCATLQKQVDDYEEQHPRYTTQGAIMDTLNIAHGLASKLGRTKVSIFKEFAEKMNITDTEQSEGWELLRDQYKRWLKNPDSS